MFLLDHGKVKEDLEVGMTAVTELLQKHGCNIVKSDKWDERKLAYEINNQKRGVYVLVHFEGTAEAIPEIRADAALNDVISRLMIIRLTSVFPPFMTARELDDTFGSRDFREGGPKRWGSKPGGGRGGPRPGRPASDAPRAGGSDGAESPKTDGESPEQEAAPVATESKDEDTPTGDGESPKTDGESPEQEAAPVATESKDEDTPTGDGE